MAQFFSISLIQRLMLILKLVIGLGIGLATDEIDSRIYSGNDSEIDLGIDGLLRSVHSFPGCSRDVLSRCSLGMLSAGG